MDAVDDITSRLRQPEYTGENRCLPRTVANTGITAISSVCVGVATWILSSLTLGFVTGLATLVVGAVLTYLRGYLFPGTPELTKRCFRPWLLSILGKQPTAELRADGKGGIDRETVLMDAGALEECADRDDLCLDSSFRERWYDEIYRVAETEEYEGLFHILDIEDGTITTLEEGGENLQAQVDGSFVGTWKSRAMFIADVAASEILSREDDAWTELSPHDRNELLNGLRLFIDRCPACGGGVGLGTETIETDRQSRDVAVVDCQDCGSRLFETRTWDE